MIKVKCYDYKILIHPQVYLPDTRTGLRIEIGAILVANEAERSENPRSRNHEMEVAIEAFQIESRPGMMARGVL
jgi:hypothetical protein